jgi:hypothetical protein
MPNPLNASIYQRLWPADVVLKRLAYLAEASGLGPARRNVRKARARLAALNEAETVLQNMSCPEQYAALWAGVLPPGFDVRAYLLFRSLLDPAPEERRP